MSRRRTQAATTTDGVTIGGAVRGTGPPLVLLQGIIGDGDIDWQALAAHLTGRFTCHLPSWRGRGRSSDHPDLGYGRLVDDVLAYVDSIGEPVGLIGWSGGAGLALTAAARSGQVTPVAAVEPFSPHLMDGADQAALGDAVGRMGELAAEGRFVDGLRAFAGFVFSDEEIAVAEDAGYLESAARYVPALLNFFRQQVEYRGPTHGDPAVLRAISAPVLVLVGSDTKAYATAGAQYVADHVPDARVHELPDAGHASPLTHPEVLADVLTEFFAPTQQRT